jgi:hypothetical protein
MPRKMGGKDEHFDNESQKKEAEAKFNYDDAAAKIADSLNQTSDEIQQLINNNPDNAVEAEDTDKGAFFKDPEEGQQVEAIPTEKTPDVGYVAKESPGMTLHDKSIYEGKGFDAAIEVKSPAENRLPNKTARPSKKIDLSNIDESHIMEMPSIKAASFEIIDILNPKPKDPAIRFKWANYKNAVAGNLGRLKSLGFEVAHIDDVDLSKSHIDPSMIEGTQVKYYDVILLKIGTMRLMSLYKANILKSISKLARMKEKGIKEAENDFKTSVQGVPGASMAYNKMKEALGGKEPVSFFVPTE